MTPRQRDRSSQKDGGRKSPQASGDAGTGSIARIALEAMRDAPPWVKVLVAALAIFAIVVLVIAAQIASTRPDLAFWLSVVCAVPFVVGIGGLVLIVWLYSRRMQPRRTGAASVPTAPPVAPVWAREVPRLPIPEAQLTKLRGELRAIRDRALVWLNANPRNLNLPPEHVRANVFLPDTKAASRGQVCELIMLPELQVNMEHHPDENITFLPNQGLTGAVFVRQEQLMVCSKRCARKGEEGDIQVYPLTDAQMKQIHPDMAWIVSFPLKVGNSVGGVLNLDGLGPEVDENVLSGLMGQFAFQVQNFAAVLAKAPKKRVSITVEDIADAERVDYSAPNG